VTNSASEQNTANNTAFASVTITGSYDPNDKNGRTSSGWGDFQYFLDQDSYITYTVRFQNTGTAAAETVVIRDTIDSDLDLSSLEILGASHAFAPSFGAGRELVFSFANIALPDSGTDFLGSQGAITYRLALRVGLLVGEVIENTADIFFDFNPPVITNTVSHVVELSTDVTTSTGPCIRLWPNPASTSITITSASAVVPMVLDLSGRVLHLPFERHNGGVTIDVRDLPNGIYAVRTAEGTARFVKR
jgi:uncharacterized repeat protein (TIGR01451 family)